MEPLSENQFDLNAIKTVEPKTIFDAKKYDGVRVKIAEVKMTWQDSHYINGNYDATRTVKLPYIVITTEVVDVVGEGENKIEIKANARFSLQQNEKGEFVISKHPKGKLWKFMRKMGVDKLDDLKGKLVTLTTEPSRDENDDRLWLKIVV